MIRLFDDLEKSLLSQRMVWLEGLHFPEEIRLRAGLEPVLDLAK